MTSRSLGFALIVLTLVRLSAAESISNSQLTLSWDQSHFTLLNRGATSLFGSGSSLSQSVGLSKTAPINDPDFGLGQQLEVAYDDGSRDVFQLFNQLPFLLCHSILVNRSSEPKNLNRIPCFRANLDFDQPPTNLVALGTGGLKPASDTNGSYAWLALADPKSRAGVVAGWLTDERSSGVIFSKVVEGQIEIEARAEYGRLRIDAGATVETETFMLGSFPDARLGLEAWADAVAKRLKIHLPPQPVVYCTWYDDVHGGSSDAASLAQLTAFAGQELAPYGLSCVQIDDGWQLGDPHGNGPRKNFSAFNPAGPYPAGMKPTADDIRSHGLIAGLWLLPFGGSWNDPFFAPHQDWFVRRQDDGKPFDTAWGGTALDMTEQGARAFVSNEVNQAVNQWGYHYLKIDGLSTGCGVTPQYVNSDWKEDHLGDGVFHDPNKSNLDAYRSGLRLVRAAAGPGTFILGCCAPQNMRSYGGSFGLVDAMRTGPDNGGSWNDWFNSSPTFAGRNNHLNGRIWWNDPDPIYVRTNIPIESARCIASWNAIAGHMISLSDWFPSLPLERLDIIRRVIPYSGAVSRPLDLFSAQPPRIWLATDERPNQQRRDVVGLFNWDEQEASISANAGELGLPPASQYVAFDFWNKTFLPPFTNELTLRVPGHGCRILAVRPLLPRPFLLSSSRHVSQGILEVRDEVWNAETLTLSGVSKVVANDPYELRIVALSPEKIWSISEISILDKSSAREIPVAYKFEEGLLRVNMTSWQSADLTWRIRFKSEARAPKAP
jgi:hypothetical protein